MSEVAQNLGNVWKSCVTPKNTVKNVEKAFLLVKLQPSLDFPIWSLFVPLCDQNGPMLEKCSLKEQGYINSVKNPNFEQKLRNTILK